MAVTTTLYYKIDTYIGDDGFAYGVRIRNNKPSPDLESWSPWTIADSNPPWNNNKQKLVSFNIQTSISPQYCRTWFMFCPSLTNIQGLSNLDTSNVTNMNSMFNGCQSLTSIDVSGFDTSNVISMNQMFYNCSSLTTLDLSDFDTSNVAYMSSMFENCQALTTLDVSGFDTSNVVSMSYMFRNCSSLTTLDVSGFDTSNLAYMGSIFENCQALTTLDLSNFDTSNVAGMTYLFCDCSALMTLDVSGFDTSNVTTMSGIFDNCQSLTTLDLSSFDTSNVNIMSYMFRNCSALTSLDVSGFDTSNATNMQSMFYNCRALTSLDVSGFDTSNVTNMQYMFYGCSALISLDLSNFDTSNVTGMLAMFYNCQALTSLDVSEFDTSNVTDMQVMFYNCQALTSLDVSGFDTSNVTNMWAMFRNCSALTSLDVSEFDTSNVANMSETFYNCQALTSLDVSGFDTSNVANMSYMFYGCSALMALDVSGFDTSKVTNMRSMFYNCQVLTSLDVSGFDTSIVTDMQYMFYSCSLLSILYFPLYVTAATTTGLFRSDTNQHYLLKKGSTTSEVETFWRNIASQYSNVHYEFDDNPLPSLSDFSVTRVASSGSRDYSEMGSYAYFKVKANASTNVIPPGYTNSIKSFNLSEDGTAIYPQPVWTASQDYMEAWFDVNNTTLNHTFSLTVSDSIKVNGVEKGSRTSEPLSIILQKAYALFDIFHDDDENVEGLAIGAFATVPGTLEVGLPSIFYETVEKPDMTQEELEDFLSTITPNTVDFVVEQGTSGMWTYRKWNSGVAECWGRFSESIAVTTQSAAYGGYRSGAVSVTNYPFNFSENPSVVASGTANMNGCWVNLVSTGTAGATLYLSSGTSQSATTRTINIQAIGRWK